MAFVEMAKASEIPPGTMKHVETGKIEILLVNVDRKLYALSDSCATLNLFVLVISVGISFSNKCTESQYCM
ncbi:MAG: Rieske 2Fe-2S domain-containing protein [Methanoregulaceae archaeon]|jgi:nitrite reductase/ring-hydroxylating ferredoxin subunit